MRIWDTFLFRDELDMLECRLVQLEDSPVYRHVLVEAAVDHQGHPKPLVYAENRERFAPWADRIVHVTADSLPAMTGAAPLEREAAQRDALAAGLADAEPDDWLVLADVDEIPGTSGIRAMADGETGILEMTCCMFAVDWVWGPLRTSVLCAAGTVTSLSATRRAGWEWRRIPAAGHHLTWLGGRDAITAKAAAHCHTECNPDITAANAADELYRHGHDPFTRLTDSHGRPLTPVDVDETWPRWVRERSCPPSWFRPREG